MRMAIALNVVMFLAMLTVLASNGRTADARPRVLTVSQIDVVDSHGVVRARIGGDLPPGIFKGKPVPRHKAAGILLYDETGQERGGYVTFSPGRQVALTLDNATSPSAAAMLIAGAEAGAALTISYANDVVELRVDDDTGPSIHAMQAKQVVFHVPPVKAFEKTEACGEMRSALAKTSRDEVLTACRSRVSEEACQACLGPAH